MAALDQLSAGTASLVIFTGLITVAIPVTVPVPRNEVACPLTLRFLLYSRDAWRAPLRAREPQAPPWVQARHHWLVRDTRLLRVAHFVVGMARFHGRGWPTPLISIF